MNSFRSGGRRNQNYLKIHLCLSLSPLVCHCNRTTPPLDDLSLTDHSSVAGRYSCIGKQLGLMELRYVVAQIVRQYDVGLAPGQAAKAFLDGKKDTFTLSTLR